MAHTITATRGTIAFFKGESARLVLRGLAAAGGRIVARARSAHGSDCPWDAAHLAGRMGGCRCVRVMRVRTRASGDWLLAFGDRAEGQTIILQGPYALDASLQYGGGFWECVTV